jgi:hypothetical protein
MATTTVNIKLSPSDYRMLRDELTEQVERLESEHATLTAIRGVGNAKRRQELTTRTNKLRDLLGQI